ncbi:MAG: ATP-binding cassette domain-containing protein [Gemmatimonadetes bacterium]|nr:ATP-binding cassette domain-containing protein [Gemmatimonadota bacterium]
MSVLRALQLHHDFGPLRVLNEVSLEVADGEVVAIVGQSGSGKTTLLRSFNRMVEPTGGSVHLDGTDIRTIPVTTLRRHIGYVPQNGGLLPHWSILRNTALVPTLLELQDAATRAADALTLVGLPPTTFGARYPWQLSGGQRQRAALARALAAHQATILLDEPFGALDAISRAELHETFLLLRRERRFTGVLVTHDLGEAARLADRIAVMKEGRIEQLGTLSDLQRAPTPYVAQLLSYARASTQVLA